MVKLVLVLLFVSQIFAQGPPIPDPFNAIPPAWGVPLSKTSTSDNVRAEYRALTGEGNNVANPLWGTDLAAYIRTQGPVNYVAGTMDGIDRKFNRTTSSLTIFSILAHTTIGLQQDGGSSR